jgi:hypothetical protein
MLPNHLTSTSFVWPFYQDVDLPITIHTPHIIQLRPKRPQASPIHKSVAASCFLLETCPKDPIESPLVLDNL